MVWAYRILYRKDGRCRDGYGYELHEVYYDDKGRIEGYTSEPTLTGESKAEIIEELAMMLQDAAGRTTLDADELDRDAARRKRLLINRFRQWWETRIVIPFWIWRGQKETWEN